MLALEHPSQTCDGLSRRRFLRVGTLALCGLTLADLLRLRATAGTDAPRAKSAIMIHLSGGPSHLDMYDMKPQAPVEYRGEFDPIRTNVPGMEICELMPLQAQIADKFAILRGAQIANLHTGNMFYSGFPWQESPRPRSRARPAVPHLARLSASSAPERRRFRRMSASRIIPIGNGRTMPAWNTSRCASAAPARARRSTTWGGTAM